MSVRLPTAIPRFALILLSCAAVPAPADEPSRTNRLIHEKSPYLLQHARNPVDWYPWGEEAFARAGEENKPVFLSIGYSTCHWCHVMANESFSDPGFAAILNEHFISIKVDREERPDVDALYLAYLEATRGGGGWPANLFLTPDGTPFFGGTYYPRTSRDGMPGFEEVILRVAALWESRPESLKAAGAQTITLLESLAQPAPGEDLPGRESLDRTFSALARGYRPDSGGFGPAPRFPEPSLHAFLLRYAERNDKGSAARMTLETLRAMARGGIHDQIGGGFHRYATDEHWRVPHFEKMLYDQAQMATLYFDAWRLSRDPGLLQVGTGTLDLVLREMTEPGAGFHSAIDAASSPSKRKAPVEGAYYTWSVAEIAVLIPDEKRLELALDAFGIDADGNVPQALDPSGDLEGVNILNRERDLAALARDHEMSPEDARTALDDLRDLLIAARSERPRPLVDDKILTGWNGLMISAFSTGFEATGNPRYLHAAIGAADFLEANLWDADTQTLWRRWREGEPGIRAFSEDYAFLIRGLLDLYGASFDVRWLELARDLQLRQDELFWNDEDGIYSMSGDRPDGVSIDLAGRIDSAMPSHNSISVFNLLELSQITGNDAWSGRARRILTAFGPRLSSAPASAAMMAAALDTALSKPRQIIVAGDPERADTKAMLELIRTRFLPDSLVLLADGGRGQEKLAEWLPSMESIRPVDGKATAYVCENFVCELPTNDLDEIARQLD